MIGIDDLQVRFNTEKGVVHAVRGVTIDVAAGEFYTLLGPSGCGKTTTLRCLAGLERPTGGRITVGNAVVHDSGLGVSVPTHKRDIGMVFQSYAIWPHLTVFENVAFPLREKRPKIDEAVIRDRVANALELVQLSGYESRPAPFLSGGQQQRLALARAIVREASVVLFDEPLSNLDAKLRAETRLELRKLVKRLGMTALYVTHDQTEALTMADRVAVMRDGEIVQEASPVEIYMRPNSRFVASFIGQCNFAGGTVRRAVNGSGVGQLETEWGPMQYSVATEAEAGEDVTVAVRPENVRLIGPGADGLPEGEIVEKMFLGDCVECRVSVGTAHIFARVHPSQAVEVGQRIGVDIRPEDVALLSA
ncbi:ABC transporter ATP-binding protein [Wenxinia marina]|uniref:ABC-type spermidine/putrescine transport system, ATPase component n=1 Tax=Wenxinia marina DSM 24838 TaxID=1123501 RepID=A0A0D0QDB3_9RHOB|nr:ABC transporter ATP-binding protein [Wenxinia marina]KIQ68993.1 ABC-type spermidine/putrescine transport system, ATPase component [Wenxinia marina DSM 24838]GGL80949.1 ABC transporter ATP-binding protein [Wenxinia marina]